MCNPKVIFRSERKIKKVFTSIFKITSVQLVFEKILFLKWFMKLSSNKSNLLFNIIFSLGQLMNMWTVKLWQYQVKWTLDLWHGRFKNILHIYNYLTIIWKWWWRKVLCKISIVDSSLHHKFVQMQLENRLVSEIA